jgi:hypothetical protein
MNFRSDLLSLAASILLPLFPVVLAEIPYSQIMKGVPQILKAVPMKDASLE